MTSDRTGMLGWRPLDVRVLLSVVLAGCTLNPEPAAEPEVADGSEDPAMSVSAPGEPQEAVGAASSDSAESAATSDELVLFDGSALGDFEVSVFGGDGDVWIEDGHLRLGIGQPLTGVNWAGEDLPRDGYEIEFTAARVAGTDFFCGLTVPVGEDGSGTLVLGGWAGAVSGFSCIDGADASGNETTRSLYFETGVDHRVRLRVTHGAKRAQAWVGDDQLFDVDIDGKLVEIRPEVEPSLPFGLCSYVTEARIGPVRLRRLPKP